MIEEEDLTDAKRLPFLHPTQRVQEYITLLIDVLQGHPSLRSPYPLGEFSADLCRLLQQLQLPHGSGIRDQPIEVERFSLSCNVNSPGKSCFPTNYYDDHYLLEIRFTMIDRGDRTATSVTICNTVTSTTKLSADADRREAANVAYSGGRGEYSTRVEGMHYYWFRTNDLPVEDWLFHASVCA